jgi:hypothetical protein
MSVRSALVAPLALGVMMVGTAQVARAQTPSPAQPQQPATQQPATPQPATPPAAAQAAPEKAENPTFTAPAGLLLVQIKPDKTADYEAMITKLKDALSKSEKPERKAQAQGWKIFKTDLPGPSGAVTYFAIVDPVIKGNDYNMRAILTEAFGVAETNTIYKTLADSVAGQQLVALTTSVTMQ